MANLLHGNPAFKAAQSKLAIAQFIGNSEMWSEAFSFTCDGIRLDVIIIRHLPALVGKVSGA